MGVEPTQNCKQLLPGLKSGRPTGSDSLPFCGHLPTFISRAANYMRNAHRLLLRDPCACCRGRGLRLLRCVGQHSTVACAYRTGGEYARNRRLQRCIRDQKTILIACDFAPPEITRDKDGFLVTDASLQTAIAGVFAAGAVRAGYGGMLTDAAKEAQTAATAARARLAKQ